MRRVSQAQTAFRVDRFHAQSAHQGPSPVASHVMSLRAQPIGQATRSIKRMPCVLFVNQPQQQQGFLALPLGMVVIARPRKAQQFALPGNG